eukprot:CAMPEP_0182859988 /NCGR_PEP_ID=MMETSP0034_2-20130328/4642_1 /TAXON_ID=156128 /ORGANISM="Nephroselmis pyriformis, Strain CCMP717" /LENGTH=68 /DNA_ID=CAMNT_0024991703 /DNA_START=125 /DNA_END=328 /DNA_ORIENTATION=-
MSRREEGDKGEGGYYFGCRSLGRGGGQNAGLTPATDVAAPRGRQAGVTLYSTLGGNWSKCHKQVEEWA